MITFQTHLSLTLVSHELQTTLIVIADCLDTTSDPDSFIAIKSDPLIVIADSLDTMSDPDSFIAIKSDPLIVIADCLDILFDFFFFF